MSGSSTDRADALCAGAWCSVHGSSCSTFALAARAETLENALPALDRLYEVANDFLCSEYPRGTGHPADHEAARLSRAVAEAGAALNTIRPAGRAVLAPSPASTPCPTCRGNRWLDENGNPYVAGRSDSYECPACSPASEDDSFVIPRSKPVFRGTVKLERVEPSPSPASTGKCLSCGGLGTTNQEPISPGRLTCGTCGGSGSPASTKEEA